MFTAGCSIIGIFGVLGETSILAIVIIASASVLTIFVSIMVWQIVRHRKINVQTLKSDNESHIHAKTQPNEGSSETAESQIRENASKSQYVERVEDHRTNVLPRDHAVEKSNIKGHANEQDLNKTNYHNRKDQANEQDLNKTDYHKGEGQLKDQVFDRAEDHKKEDQINDQALNTAKNMRKKLPKDQDFERSEYKNRKGPPKDQAVERAEYNSRRGPPKDQAVERAEYNSRRGPPKGPAAERAEYQSKVDPPKDQPFERAEYHLKESPPNDQTYERAEGKTKKQGVINADYYRNAPYETKNRATVSKLSTPVTERPPKVEKATKGTTRNQKRSSMPPVEETNKKSRP
ncbi:hypothetical protein CHS0354_017492 [Potamilus streckersoni]|uniref:Uncharacterized protein n=1 Tax=Potamilus streckersoni TaxID=2493646 RepID=A0AAE0W4V9_9BIVA|nr:hypothetical protein CHS0354_017492 [Potamilus streckersoni]